MVTINQQAVCFNGPGTIYPLNSLLLVGDQVVIAGCNSTNDWFWIEKSGIVNGCWINNQVVSFQGDLTVLPVFTPGPTPVISPSATLESKGLKIFMISLNTGGSVGCGDDAVWFYSGVPSKNSPAQNALAALNALFSIKTETYAGYTNSIYASNMHAQSINFDPSTGLAIIYLSGTFTKPKDLCEAARMRAQIWSTIYQFEPIKKANIWIGNKLLGDLLNIPGH
jgi:hypothetical protein